MMTHKLSTNQFFMDIIFHTYDDHRIIKKIVKNFDVFLTRISSFENVRNITAKSNKFSSLSITNI